MSLLNLTLKVWRQKNNSSKGELVTYNAPNISPDMSFLEMLDIVNEKLIEEHKEPIAFESDCREGICGACSMVINGIAHGKERGTTACQLHMRHFKDGETITIEPWRAKAFAPIKDLVVDRSAFDRIQQAGGFISVNTGSAPDAHSILVHKDDAEKAFDSAACIGCGACVAACKNASAMLFVGSKISQLSHLPQGDPERKSRAKSMIMQMDAEGFGSCTNTLECEAVCPKEISTRVISELNWEFMRS
ncbi:MAG: succinate dehydrogenase/fumarate reductase iron-sulfur subunit [Myxococcaceae bacterium]